MDLISIGTHHIYDIRGKILSSILQDLKETGFEYIGYYQLHGWYPYQSNIAKLMRDDVEFADAIELQLSGARRDQLVVQSNELTKALFSRSESELINSLRKHYRAINVPNDLNILPLYCALDWPQGVAFMLEHGADLKLSVGLGGYSILQYAVIEGGRQTVELLIKNGAWGMTVFFSLKDITDSEVVDLLIEELTSRRMELLQLAKQLLDPSQLSWLLESDGEIVDTNVRKIYNLVSEKFEIPPILDTSFIDNSSIFHFIK